MSEFFDRDKPTAECLSRFQISKYSLDSLPGKEQLLLEKHLETCQRCQQLVQEERLKIEAAVYEAVPEKIQSAATQFEKKTARNGWILSFAGVATVCLMAFFLLTYLKTDHELNPESARDRIRLKGTIDLNVALRRRGRIFDARPLDKLTKLKDGDELRLQVVGGRDGFARLRSCEVKPAQCGLFFKGKIPSGGWLPVGLTATPGKMRLELFVCKNKQKIDHPTEHEQCQQKIWLLEVF